MIMKNLFSLVVLLFLCTTASAQVDKTKTSTERTTTKQQSTTTQDPATVNKDAQTNSDGTTKQPATKKTKKASATSIEEDKARQENNVASPSGSKPEGRTETSPGSGNSALKPAN